MRKFSKQPTAALSFLIDALEGRRMFAFGVTTTTGTNSSFIADNGSGLVISVLKNGASVTSTKHLGDMTSAKINGTEVLASYAATGRYSHYEQGLSGSAVISATVDPAGQWIKITADDSAAASGGVIHYYVLKRNDSNIYMASLPTDVNNGPGEGRYIAYLDKTKFTNIEAPSDNTNSNGTVEGSDVFYNTTTGYTSSKFYAPTDRRMIDNIVHGVTGTGVGAFMYMGNREHSAGGPFFKDIDFQSSGSQVEIYNCVFTGHTQTEAYRQGLQGPYALQLTNGSQPTAPNYSFLEGVGISGLLPASARGAISGTASGVPVGHESVVTLSNTAAQYWAYANASTGAYTISGVQPGTYTETLYDNELAVGTRTVTVSAGNTTRANLASTYYTPNATWRIGTWDGTPRGFLNADKLASMHPSDPRMASWNLPSLPTVTDPSVSLPTFVVGADTDPEFPMAQFMDVNNSTRLQFTLTAAQASQAQTLRIGITLGFEGGRNRITVNAGQSYFWTSAIPAASRDLNSRGITRGTYRGDNQLYTYNIPTSALKAGVNTIDIPVVSGSYVAGQGFLSPNVAYDAIDLVPTSSLAAPVASTISVSPANAALPLGGTQTFVATGRTSAGVTVPTNVVWKAVRGTINDAGEYVAPATAGPDTITATSGTVSGSTTINILTAAPGVATPASGSPNPVFNNKTTLTVLGNDLAGEATLTYTWATLGTPPGPVSFAATNGTNAGKNTIATFTTPGSYAFRVTITDGSGLSTTSDTTVNVYDKKAWLKADETAGTTLADSSGAGNSATLTGSYAFGTGIDNNSVKFTGGYATLPNGITTATDDFTVGAWVKPDVLQSWARLFDFGTGTSAYMFFTPRTNAGVSRFAITTSGGAGEQIINGPALAAGVWTHVAVTLSGNTATLYLNGVAVGSNSNVTTHPSALGNTTGNYIGKSQFAADPTLLASVDDFRLYGKTLTAAEIGAWYAVAAPKPVITGFAIDDGTSQRSMVRSVTVTFDQKTAFDADDLTLLLNGTAVATTMTVTPTSSAGTQFVVTFSGAGTANGSLADGRYQLLLNGATITGTNGVGMATNTTYDFFRLAGDSDGNATVDFNDFLALQNAFGSTTGSANYVSGIDTDASGVIDFNDFLVLQNQFGKTLPPAVVDPAVKAAPVKTATTPVRSTTAVTKPTAVPPQVTATTPTAPVATPAVAPAAVATTPRRATPRV